MSQVFLLLIFANAYLPSGAHFFFATLLPHSQIVPDHWKDPSPHKTGFVRVNGVRLHDLDWGGKGETLLFLHGLSLKKLLIRLFVTDFAHHLKAELPVALQNLRLPASGRPNAVVCLAQWRDSSSRGSSFDRLSGLVAALIKLEDYLHLYEINALLEVMSFELIEKSLASNLRMRVQQTAQTINAEEVRVIAALRKSGHWAAHRHRSRRSPTPGLLRCLQRADYSSGILRSAQSVSAGLQLRRRRDDVSGL